MSPSRKPIYGQITAYLCLLTFKSYSDTENLRREPPVTACPPDTAYSSGAVVSLQYETKEKLPFSGFYGNSTQEHFFLAIYGSPDIAVNLMKESLRMTNSERRCSSEAMGSGGVNVLSPSMNKSSIVGGKTCQLMTRPTALSCLHTKCILHLYILTLMLPPVWNLGDNPSLYPRIYQ